MRQTPLLKLYKPHGDIYEHNADHLVFTNADYELYLTDDKKKLIRGEIQSLCSERSFLFVGYSLDDINIRTVLQEVKRRAAEGGIRHFLLVDQVDQTKREEFAKHYATDIIVLGKYSNLISFLEALKQRVHELRPSAAGVQISPQEDYSNQETDRLANELLAADFGEIKEQLNRREYVPADKKLRDFLAKLKSSDACSRPGFRDLLQRIYLNLSVISTNSGNPSDAMAQFELAEKAGPFEGIRRVHAAEVLIALGHAENAIKLLKGTVEATDGPGKRILEVASLITKGIKTAPRPQDLSGYQNIDLLLNGLCFGIVSSKEDDFAGWQALLEKAWAIRNNHPVVMRTLAQLADQLFKIALKNGWKLHGISRGKLLATIRQWD